MKNETVKGKSSIWGELLHTLARTHARTHTYTVLSIVLFTLKDKFPGQYTLSQYFIQQGGSAAPYSIVLEIHGKICMATKK